uniref:Uncharacterized protein n=1 Tax=Arundo donax TaxID=35708 RepID=A0A0A9EX70_ARUDO
MTASKNPSWRSPRLLPSRSRSKKQEAAPAPHTTVPARPSKNQEHIRRPVLPFAKSPGLSRTRSSSRCTPAAGASTMPARCSTECAAGTCSPGRP